jgi:hypothetical protein
VLIALGKSFYVALYDLDALCSVGRYIEVNKPSLIPPGTSDEGTR